jgi:hypothetical protein
MRQSEFLTFDPGFRSSSEILFGPPAHPPGEIRGRSVRGRARYSTDEAVRSAIRHAVARLTPELAAFAKRRLNCGYAHSPSVASCPDVACEAWSTEVVAWHSERFGSRHFDITLSAVFELSRGRRPPLRVYNSTSREAFEPTTVALDPVVRQEWIEAALGLHGTATKADAHDLIDRLWPEVERMRALDKRAGTEVRPGRVGQLDRPARTVWWTLRRFAGLTIDEIVTEWETLTSEWHSAQSGPNPSELVYPAWLEWHDRGNRAGAERIAEPGTVARSVLKFRRLTRAGSARTRP